MKRNQRKIAIIIVMLLLATCAMCCCEEQCQHDYVNGICAICGVEMTQEEKDACVHDYQNGVCSICGTNKPLENVRLLLIGNSYTYFNDSLLKNALIELAKEVGYNLTVDQVAYGSAYLSDYCTGSYSAEVENLLATNSYDYAVLQEQSTAPITAKATFLRDCEDLCDKIVISQPDVEIFLFATWARKAGNSWYSTHPAYTVTTMKQTLQSSYETAATSVGGTVVPVGNAFGIIIDSTEMNLYNNDGTHPSARGSYLAALTHCSVIFGVDVKLCSYVPNGISAEDAVTLKNAAYQATH